MTTREAALLERDEARVDHKEFVAARDGHIGAKEQKRIQRAENQQSRRIHHEKTDGDARKS